MNSIITVITGGKERYITDGEIILLNEGKIDLKKLDKEVYYTDENCKKQVIATGMIDIREIISAEEVIGQIMETVIALIVACNENSIAQLYKIGETVCTHDGLVRRIDGKNEDSIYYLFIPFLQCMQQTDIKLCLSFSNLCSIENYSMVDYIDTNENIITYKV